MKKCLLIFCIAIGMVLQTNGQNPIIDWETTFDGVASTFDEIRFIRTDSDDNVYVTGRSNGGATSSDVITKKYSSTGNLLWSHSYNNSDYNLADQPFDMELTSNGDVVVIGRTRTSTGFNPNSIGFVFMINGTSGTQMWLDTIKGPGFSGSNFSILRKLVISTSDEIYVTGNYTGASSFLMVTAKYNTAGNQLWLQTFDNSTDPSFHENAGADISLDANGNVHVAGFTKLLTSGENFALWKINPSNGNQVWIATKPGPVNNTFTGGLKSVITDGDGNSYVYGVHSGDKHRIVKYDDSGNEAWAFDFDTLEVGFTASFTGADNHLTFDNYGDVVFASVFGTSPTVKIGIAKFSSTGNLLWFKFFSGTSTTTNNEVYGVVTDAIGNIYFTGATSNPDFDVETFKLDANGDLMWRISKNGSLSANDKGHSIALDNAGSVYVGGLITTDSTDGDYYIVKFLDLFFSTKDLTDNENQISIYPNPFSKETVIQLEKSISNGTITIYNSLGQKVKEVKHFNGQTLTLSRDQLSEGMYFIHLAENKKISSIDKLIITD